MVVFIYVWMYICLHTYNHQINEWMKLTFLHRESFFLTIKAIKRKLLMNQNWKLFLILEYLSKELKNKKKTILTVLTQIDYSKIFTLKQKQQL